MRGDFFSWFVSMKILWAVVKRYSRLKNDLIQNKEICKWLSPSIFFISTIISVFHLSRFLRRHTTGPISKLVDSDTFELIRIKRNIVILPGERDCGSSIVTIQCRCGLVSCSSGQRCKNGQCIGNLRFHKTRIMIPSPIEECEIFSWEPAQWLVLSQEKVRSKKTIDIFA